MKVKLRRLEGFLRPEGFILSHWSKEEKLLLYSRPTPHEGVFEHIMVWSRGRHGEVASVDAKCAAAWGSVAREFMSHSELITELGGPSGRGVHEFTSPKDVEFWERRVAEVAPMKCRELAAHVGAEFESRTREARHAAWKYLALWGGPSEERLRDLMRSRSTEAQIARAGTLARLPRVVLSFDKQELYTDVILGLMHDAPTVEGRDLIGSPWTTEWDDPTYQRIELIADRLLHPQAFVCETQ